MLFLNIDQRATAAAAAVAEASHRTSTGHLKDNYAKSVPCEFKLDAMQQTGSKQTARSRFAEADVFFHKHPVVKSGSPDEIVFDHHLTPPTPRTPHEIIRIIMKNPRSSARPGINK